MKIAESKVTAQGQVSVPAEVRKKFGIEPGAVIEWKEESGSLVVRRRGKYTSQDIYNAIFKGKKPTPKTIEEMDEGIRQHIRREHARGRY